VHTLAGAEASNRYLAHLHARQASRGLKGHVRTVLPQLIRRLDRTGVADLRQVSESHLVSFAHELRTKRTKRGSSLSLPSQASYLGAVKGFFSFMENEGLLLRNPALVLTRPRLQRLPRAVLGPVKARRLVTRPPLDTALGQRDRAILEMLYGTGIRAGECERLELMDVDLAGGTLLIRNGKGRKDRYVPLAGRAARALELYLREARPAILRDPGEPAVFLSRGGKRCLQLQSIERLVRKHAAAAGIGMPITPHSLRHACATHLLQGGADVRHVQELLGHRDIATTALYTHVTIEDLRRAIERAHPREKTWKAGGRYNLDEGRA
jgi:integrase/recombinase XerD